MQSKFSDCYRVVHVIVTEFSLLRLTEIMGVDLIY